MQDFQKTEQDLKFEEFLSAQGYQIKSFYTQNPENLFQNAINFPPFFSENLVSPNRVLKQFIHNPHANIKIFYYQLLRVTYQIETINGYNRSFMRNLIRIIFNSGFQILFTPDSQAQRDVFNDFQFKKLFAQFIQLLQNQEAPNIQNIINCFPIIDTIFIHIFRSLLTHQGLNIGFDEKIETQALFSALSDMLGLNVTSYDKCWKFEDSDMFCYQENDEQLYLAYILELAEDGQIAQESANYNEGQYSNSLPNTHVETGITKQNISHTQQEYVPKNSVQNNPPLFPEHKKQQNQPRQSMISQTYQFVDFTNTTTLYKQKKPKPKTNQILPPTTNNNPEPIVYMSKEQNISLSIPEKNTQYTDFKPQPIPNFTSSYFPQQQPVETYTNQYNFSQKYKISQTNNYNSYSFDLNSNNYGINNYSSDNYSYEISSRTKNYDEQNTKPVYDSYKVEYKPYQFSATNYQISNNYNPIPIPITQHVQPQKFLVDSKKYQIQDSTPIYKLANNNNKYNPISLSNPKQYPSTKQEYYQTNTYNLTNTPVSTLNASNIKTTSTSNFANLISNNNNYASNSNQLGDYYKDFTNSFTLQKILEPHKSNIKSMKNRMKGVRRAGINGNISSVVGTNIQKSVNTQSNIITIPVVNGGNRLQSNNNYGQYGIQGSYSGSNSYSQSLENSKLQYTGGSTNNNYYYDVKDNYY